MYEDFQTFLADWNNPNHPFSMSTSGSTGVPKKINLSREKLLFSVAQTAASIAGIESQSILCCLPTHKIGGFMQLVRAAVWGVSCKISVPSTNPLAADIAGEGFENISLSPQQVYHILSDKYTKAVLFNFKTILVGGAAIGEDLLKRIADFDHPNLYFTYGMTETYSHLALRKFPAPYFTLLDGVEGKTNSEGMLMVCSKITDNLWLSTHDLVVFKTKNTFEFVGRKDDVINTGGVKYDAVLLENAIAHLIKMEFYISSIKDEVLGEKIALIVKNALGVDLKVLNSVLKNTFGSSAKIRTIIEHTIEMDRVTGKVQRRKF